MNSKIEEALTKAPSSLPLQRLGELKQLGFVARNLTAAVNELRKIGIGPWKTYTFDSSTVVDRTYFGKPTDHAHKIALAEMPGMTWEVIEPLHGDNIYTDFLNLHGEGLHHLLFDAPGITLTEKFDIFDRAGFSCIQSGVWMGLATYAYFQHTGEDGIIIEIVDRKPGWHRPQPDEIIG